MGGNMEKEKRKVIKLSSRRNKDDGRTKIKRKRIKRKMGEEEELRGKWEKGEQPNLVGFIRIRRKGRQNRRRGEEKEKKRRK